MVDNKTDAGVLGGREEVLLNGLWMGLLGLECLMVAGVVVRRLVGLARSGVKAKEL